VFTVEYIKKKAIDIPQKKAQLSSDIQGIRN